MHNVESSSLQQSAFDALLKQDDEQIQKEQESCVEPNGVDDVTPWLTSTQWDEVFKGKDTAVKLPTINDC